MVYLYLIIFYPHDIIISLAVLLLLFCALPALVIVVVEFVRFYFKNKNAKIINYLIFVMSVYAIGELINFLAMNKIAYFSIKLLIIIHIIFAFWIVFYYLNLIISHKIAHQFNLSYLKAKLIFVILFISNALLLKLMANSLLSEKYFNQYMALFLMWGH